MASRREFLKSAALLAAGGGVAGWWSSSIQRAVAIDPTPGSTWLDAEHVVILMQENRAFDHAYGCLRGVRGFNDPRAVTLPDGNPVWLQTNRKGETYAPFRLDLRDTKATWMSSLPHAWVDQTDARNGGHHDGWLEAKRSGNPEYAELPLTLGYYDRRDLPFYYALADAFTICDQNFCSSLTGTTPNRLYLWTGTIREKPEPGVKANVRNEDVVYNSEASWTTFPERLEALGVSWRIYQNEIGVASGLQGEANAWLANFEDNPMEWFTPYRVRFAECHRRHLQARERALPAEIRVLESATGSPERQGRLDAARAELESVREALAKYTPAAFAALSERDRSLHERAFTDNSGDPDYRELTTLTYRDGAEERRMAVPKGDVLHRFREDVRTGRLPTVSWIVAPENFSDHPGAPWYGAWYLSECLDILTSNPEVWRKTIFVLCYDENDGYFDHVPPFVPPHPTQSDGGKVSAGIDLAVEHVAMEQEETRRQQYPDSPMRSGPIGLGFRVPLVVASPWSRGGFVNSQVFDHTSILRMLERFLTHKTGKPVQEPNISAWRRTVCGDLSSVFRPYHGERVAVPESVEREAHLEAIHRAQFRGLPAGFRRLGSDEVALARKDPGAARFLPRQEPGTRPACALPYELAVDGRLSADRGSFVVRLAAGRERFGDRSAGGAFLAYVPGPAADGGRWPVRSYAVVPGDAVEDAWALAGFPEGRYAVHVHGPNGFYREFRGSAADPGLEVGLAPEMDEGRATGNLRLRLTNHDPGAELEVRVVDRGYGGRTRRVKLAPRGAPAASAEVRISAARRSGWHDFEVRVEGAAGYGRRFAGRLETGRDGTTDPLMGRA